MLNQFAQSDHFITGHRLSVSMIKGLPIDDPSRAGLYLMVLRRSPLRAAGIAWWYVTNRRVRARNRLREATRWLLDPYAAWIQTIEQPALRSADLANKIAAVQDAVRITVIVYGACATAAPLQSTIASIARQSTAPCEVIVALVGPCPPGVPATGSVGSLRYLGGGFSDSASALTAGMKAASGDFILPVLVGTLLSVSALLRLLECWADHPDAMLLYGDEDRIDDSGKRSDPWLKPRWNAEMALAQDYFSSAFAIAGKLADAALPITPGVANCAAYALLLHASSLAPDVIVHVPHVLCHLPHTPFDEDTASARLRAVQAHVRAAGATASVGPFGTVSVHWKLPAPAPPVTIIIPTRDRADLLDACVKSLMRETTYPDFDVLIVDNGSIEPATHAWFADITVDDRVSVVSYDRPYNYSAINNFAVQQSRGRYVCLLNNDTEVIDGAWLDEMMRQATRVGIGAVGAKLLYGDRSIQHAGVVIGLGNAAGHAHRGLPNAERGYFAVPHSAHFASAVTAACLVVEKTKFAAVGGLDDIDLQIAYNDVDLCLKLERAGWRNVYTPAAVLLHHESKSRGRDFSSEHLERYLQELAVLQKRWKTTEVVDPMHHPHLDRSSETYQVGF